MRTVHRAIGILQDHYPERLGSVILLMPPKRLAVSWRMLSRLVLPSSLRDKLQLVSDEAQWKEIAPTLFDVRKLESCVGGGNPTPFDARVFFCGGPKAFGLEFEAQLS